jgi:hypothetical protein
MSHSSWSMIVLFIFAFAVCMFSATLQAQTCSTRTTIGRYAVVCDGYLTPGPDSPMVPAKELATVTADENGNFQSNDGKISLGGTIVSQAVIGTEVLNPDCTGSITFTQTIDGQPAPPLSIVFVVKRHGSEIDGLSINPGTVFSCRLTRIR